MRPIHLAFVPLALITACSHPDGAAPRPLEVRAESPQSAPAAQPPAAHPHGTQNAAGQGTAVPGGARRFGEPIAPGASVARLADIVAAPAQFTGRAIRVEGTVAAVCQEMGCWMEIRDAETQAHIRMHGHSFFVPRDINGRRAAVQATVVATHSATECDRAAQTQTGRLAQVELDATGVEVLN